MVALLFWASLRVGSSEIILFFSRKRALLLAGETRPWRINVARNGFRQVIPTSPGSWSARRNDGYTLGKAPGKSIRCRSWSELSN